ncbi:hypothetical protein JW859_09430 [bacterium]|nr:hypothetical protein [bacterium]
MGFWDKTALVTSLITAIATCGLVIGLFVQINKSNAYFNNLVEANKLQHETMQQEDVRHNELRELEAYYQGSQQLTQIKQDFVDSAKACEEALDSGEVFRNCRGCFENQELHPEQHAISAETFMVICKSFLHIEHIYLLRSKGLIKEKGNWNALESGFRPFLSSPAFRQTFYNHLYKHNGLHDDFRNAVDDYYQEVSGFVDDSLGVPFDDPYEQKTGG